MFFAVARGKGKGMVKEELKGPEVCKDPVRLTSYAVGVNILKQGEDPQLKPPEQYPEWWGRIFLLFLVFPLLSVIRYQSSFFLYLVKFILTPFQDICREKLVKNKQVNVAENGTSFTQIRIVP